MARFQEKEKVLSKHPKLEKALFWSLMGVFAAITVALIVIIVLIIIGPQDKEEEKEFEETYSTAELITFEELAEILDNDTTSMPADTVYVYIYSPDYTKGENDEIINEDENTSVRNMINSCITAYADEEDGDCVFYVINITTDENEAYLSENSSFLTSNNIPTTNPVVIAISSSANGIAVVDSVDANEEIGEFVIYLENNVLGKKTYSEYSNQ